MSSSIFISGGVRSGKSAFAERYINQLKEDRHPIYIASGVAFDEEMRQRIERHQEDRASVNWVTYEVPTIFPDVFHLFNEQHILLWDCVTTWLTNILFEELAHEQLLLAIKQQLVDWRQNGVIVVIVSNEVLDDGVSQFEWTASYQQLLGELNTWLVSFCDEAYELDYGAVKRWKS